MAREIYLVGVSEEELRPNPKPEGPKDFKGKLDNFWYHYKWTVIIVAFIMVTLAIMLFQFFSKHDPDYMVVLVTNNAVDDTATGKLASEFQKYGRDINGDGKVEVQIESLYLGDNTQYSVLNKQKLIANISTGDVMFYILDSQSYRDNIAVLENQSDEKFFSKLNIQADGISQDGCNWDWKDDPLRQDPDLSSLPESLYFGVRDASGTASNKESTKIHDECMELLQAYITKTPLTASAS